MRRGTGVAVAALLLSLLLHAALFVGPGWGWKPVSHAPMAAPMLEARLLVDTPPASPRALPNKAVAVSKPASPPTPPRALLPAPPPHRDTPAVGVPEHVPDPAAVPGHAPDGQTAPPEPGAAAEVSRAPDAAPAVTQALPEKASPPRLNALPARIEMRFGVHYGVASGEQTLVWVSEGERYTLTSVATATGLAGLFYRGRFVQTSSGRITPWGLQPEVFRDQRGEKHSIANLEAARDRVSLTTASGEIRYFRYQSGMQDALSLFLQLALTAPPADDALHFVVFNGKKVRDYRFEVLGETVLETDLGPLRTLHLSRVADSDGHFEAWLAVDHAYLPVKVGRSDDKGNRMELRVRSISP